MLTPHRPRWTAAWAVLVLGLGRVACGEPPAPAPADIIAKAATAMRAVQSLHFDISTNKLDKYPAGLFIVSANGDVAQPDKLHAHAKALLASIAVQVEVVTRGSQQFMTDPASGRWQAMPPSFNVLAAFDPNKGIADILSNAKNPTSDGAEAIDGVDCYRLKVTLAPEALKALSTEVNATAPLPARLWIGQSDSLLRQAELSGPLMSQEPANIVRTLKFSQFNGQFTFPQPTVGTSPQGP